MSAPKRPRTPRVMHLVHHFSCATTLCGRSALDLPAYVRGTPGAKGKAAPICADCRRRDQKEDLLQRALPEARL